MNIFYVEEVNENHTIFRSTISFCDNFLNNRNHFENNYSYEVLTTLLQKGAITEYEKDNFHLTYKYSVFGAKSELIPGDYVVIENLKFSIVDLGYEILSEKTISITFQSSFRSLKKADISDDDLLKTLYKAYLTKFTDQKNYISGKLNIPSSNPDIVNQVLVHEVGHGNYIEVINSNYSFAIDCGGRYKHRFRKHINYFALTHWHIDHFGLLFELRDHSDTRKKFIKMVIVPELRIVCINKNLIFIKRDFDLLEELILIYGSNIKIIKHTKIDNSRIYYNNVLNITHSSTEIIFYKSSATHINNNDGLITHILNCASNNSLLCPGDSDYSLLPNKVFSVKYLIASHHLGKVGDVNHVPFSKLCSVYVSRDYSYSENKEHFDYFNNDSKIRMFSTCHYVNRKCKMKSNSNNYVGLPSGSINFSFTL